MSPPKTKRPREDSFATISTQHKQPPHSVEAEQGVIGSMMLDAAMANVAIEKIQDHEFYVPAHQTIFATIREGWEKGVTFDLITLTQKLRDMNVLDAVGGAAFVTSIYTFVPTAANIDYYIEIVKSKALLRQIIAKGSEAVRRAYEEQDDAQGLLNSIHTDLQSLGGEAVVSDSISHQVDLAIEELEQDIVHHGKKDRVPTGLIDLDRILNIMPSDMVLVTGESSSGKTALAFNIVEHTALAHGHNVLVFSIEMPTRQLIFRMMASQSKVDIRQVTQLGEPDKVKKLMDASARIKKSGIIIEDNPDLTSLQIRARARKVCSEKDIKLIVVDYLQIVSDGGKKDATEAQELSSRTMNFKKMARELKVPVILLSQIEEVTGKTYGSRAIRHHTDTLLKINQGDPATIFIDKQRNGPRNLFVKVNFFPQWTRFENYIEDKK